MFYLDTKVLQIGMSIYEVREGTLEAVHRLHSYASRNPLVNITIFNKSEFDFSSYRSNSNFSIERISHESLYATMTRINTERFSHVWWVNDDDFFEIIEIDTLKNLDADTLYLPNMFFRDARGITPISWSDLLTTKTLSESYMAYWKIGAPLIFSILPVKVFREWVTFVSADPLHLPHLDTQLNVLASLTQNKDVRPQFSYVYGTENWQDSASIVASARRHLVSQSMNPNFLHVMNLVRNIENVALVTSTYLHQPEILTRDLMKVLLIQFGPYQKGKRAWIYRKLLPQRLRLRLILRNQSLEFRVFLRNYNYQARCFIAGAINIKSREHLRILLLRQEVQEALSVPKVKFEFWQEMLWVKTR